MNTGSPGRVEGSCSLCCTHHLTHVILIRVHKQMDNVIHLQWCLDVNFIFCRPYASSRPWKKLGGGLNMKFSDWTCKLYFVLRILIWKKNIVQKMSLYIPEWIGHRNVPIVIYFSNSTNLENLYPRPLLL